MAVLWCMLLLVILFSIGFTQKNCNRPRINIDAPVFNSGDNLSVDRCGIWDQLENDYPPWGVVIRRPSGEDFWAIMISPTMLLTRDCKSGREAFEKLEMDKDWKADLGKCVLNSNSVPCVKDSERQRVKIQSVTKLNAPGNPCSIYIWTIEKATMKENYVMPICIFNKGNLQDFNRTRDGDSLLVELSEDFGPCLNQSRNLNTCDKVHENFLCVRLLDQANIMPYLTVNLENRHFLRALEVEESISSAKFYYELVPLLDQIGSASNDIRVMPKIPSEIKNKIEWCEKLTYPCFTYLCRTLYSCQILNNNVQDCSWINSNNYEVFKDGQSFPGCGTLSFNRRRRYATNYIMGGEPAGNNLYPWHVTFVDSNDNLFCGGSLVSTTAVVTAAHCFVFKDNTRWHHTVFHVVLGTVDRRKVLTDNYVLGRQRVNASKVIVHPNYIKQSFNDDIAIILLDTPVDITHLVRPICLWKDDYQFDKIHNKTGMVSGWGLTEKRTLPDKLQQVELRVVPYQECYLSDRQFFNKYLKPGKNFCAGEKVENTCMGDSGGGFTYDDDEGRCYLRGIVSFGQTYTKEINGTKFKFCKGLIPSLFVDVTYYMDWIVQHANLTNRTLN